MSHTPRLELRQSQSLVMTQQLQQSIKLLQMNAMELRVYIEGQLEQNPFLQGDEEREIERADDEARSADEADEPYETPEIETPAAPAEDEGFMPEEWREEGAQDYQAADFSDGSQLRLSVTARDSDGDELDFEDSRAQDISLHQHLTEQFHVEVKDPLLRRIGAHLIDLVNEAGYITEDLEALASQLGTDDSHIYHALAILQRLEPAGVCARNLAECLALQLREQDRLDPAMQKLLDRLPLLAEGNLTALQRHCGVDAEDLKLMIAEIRALNPKPGLAFSHEIVQVVEPDITLKREAGQKWHVELNTSALPRVLVNRRYFSKISTSKVAGRAGAQDKKYMTERMNEASWLVKALDQRANTILKVATEIVAQQENFFRMGIHHLKPLTLKDIARETGFHESTVSRVTTGKYLVSPRGMFELKYFFTSGLSHGAGGEDVSSQTVKHLIKELIDKETPETVLSDDDIAAELKRRNINVARRTVAKYREALGIASSMQRRRKVK